MKKLGLENALDESFLLNNKKKLLKDLLAGGAELEDAANWITGLLRFNNHFHVILQIGNPVTWHMIKTVPHCAVFA